MTSFVNAEHADILFIYSFCDDNATAASREYPDQRQSDSHVFAVVHLCLSKMRAIMPSAYICFSSNRQDTMCKMKCQMVHMLVRRLSLFDWNTNRLLQNRSLTYGA
jgi:hypothetical protein